MATRKKLKGISSPADLLGKLDERELQFITPGLTYKNNKPSIARLPSIESMKDLSDAELLQTLNHYKVFKPWEQFVLESAEYVNRMAGIAPGTQVAKRALRELVDISSRRALLGMCRRVTEQWSTLESIDGKADAELIWICLDDDNSCQNCLDRDGEIHQFIEWQSIGTPGSGVCSGGNYCRCSLIRVVKR